MAGIVIFLLPHFMIIYCFPLKYHSHDETNTIEFSASLKTENYEILTLEDSDNELNKGVLIGKIICGVACICLLAGAAILIVILAKTRKAL